MLLIALPVPGINADSHKHSSFSKFILSIVTLCSLVLCIRAARTEEGPEETKKWAEGTARDRWQQPLHTTCCTLRFYGKRRLGMPARMKEHCLLRPTRVPSRTNRTEGTTRTAGGPEETKKGAEGTARDHWQKSKYFPYAGATSHTPVCNMLLCFVKHMPSWLPYVKFLLGTGVPFHAANFNESHCSSGALCLEPTGGY